MNAYTMEIPGRASCALGLHADDAAAIVAAKQRLAAYRGTPEAILYRVETVVRDHGDDFGPPLPPKQERRRVGVVSK